MFCMQRDLAISPECWPLKQKGISYLQQGVVTNLDLFETRSNTHTQARFKQFVVGTFIRKRKETVKRTAAKEGEN